MVTSTLSIDLIVDQILAAHGSNTTQVLLRTDTTGRYQFTILTSTYVDCKDRLKSNQDVEYEYRLYSGFYCRPMLKYDKDLLSNSIILY